MYPRKPPNAKSHLTCPFFLRHPLSSLITKFTPLLKPSSVVTPLLKPSWMLLPGLKPSCLVTSFPSWMFMLTPRVFMVVRSEAAMSMVVAFAVGIITITDPTTSTIHPTIFLTIVYVRIITFEPIFLPFEAYHTSGRRQDNKIFRTSESVEIGGFICMSGKS